MENIQGGALKDFMNILKGISEKIFKYLSGSDSPVKVKDVKQESNGDTKVTTMYEGKIPVVVLMHKPNPDEDIYDLTFTVTDTNSKPLKFKNVKGEDFQKKLDEACKKLIDEDLKKSFGIKTSKKLNVRLQKVSAATGDEIILSGIYGDYAIPEANAILEDILVDDAFAESIPKEPTGYAITEIDDEYDVELEDFIYGDIVSQSLNAILCAAVKFNMEIQLARWETIFNKDLSYTMGDLLWESQRNVDRFGVLLIQNCSEVVNPYGNSPEQWLDMCEYTIPHSPIEVGVEYIQGVISEYIDVLDYYYPNFSHDVQYELDQIISTLKECRDLRLKQQ